MKLKTDNIFQVIDLEAGISDVYNALVDEKLHAKFTGMKASIDATIGGKFDTTDHESFGYFLFIRKNKKIVQAWSHKSFKEGFYTIVDIELEKTETGTRINFNHIGVPEEHSGWLTEGWKRIYWDPLKEFLEEKVLH
ncbi:MAG: SRPBCC domain-containing protein [Crocinitomicaceae bacterium]|nr:SRPBCC domain-containing protein [Crocinitomicaceae bacterium]